MQHRVYRLIRDKKRRGEAIHPNPWYAIVNARDAEPTTITVIFKEYFY